MNRISETTGLISQATRGSRAAIDRLFALVYDELRGLAAQRLHHERPGHTLQPTALVNEVFLRLVDQTGLESGGRAHFFAVAAEAMRRILIDHARRRGAAKRGGGWHKVTLDVAVAPTDDPDLNVVALIEALERLSALDQRLVRVVELRFFGGLSVAEVAEVLDLSKRSIESDWALARAWLRRELSSGREDAAASRSRRQNDDQTPRRGQGAG